MSLMMLGDLGKTAAPAADIQRFVTLSPAEQAAVLDLLPVAEQKRATAALTTEQKAALKVAQAAYYQGAATQGIPTWVLIAVPAAILLGGGLLVWWRRRRGRPRAG